MLDGIIVLKHSPFCTKEKLATIYEIQDDLVDCAKGFGNYIILMIPDYVSVEYHPSSQS